MLLSRPIHWNFGPLPEKGDGNALYLVVVKERKMSGWRTYTTTVWFSTYMPGCREIETDIEIFPEEVVCWAEHPYENIRDVVQKVIDKLNNL